MPSSMFERKCVNHFCLGILFLDFEKSLVGLALQIFFTSSFVIGLILWFFAFLVIEPNIWCPYSLYHHLMRICVYLMPVPVILPIVYLLARFYGALDLVDSLIFDPFEAPLCSISYRNGIDWMGCYFLDKKEIWMNRKILT